MKTTMGALALGAALVLGAGCGQAADEAAERVSEEAAEEALGGGDSNVDIDEDGNVEIETEDGSLSTGSDLPDDWPEDIPVIEGATVDGAYSSSANGESVHTASMTTDDSVADVLASYKDALSGWTVDQESTSELNGTESGVLTLSDGDRTAAITATETDGATTVSITHTGPAA